MAGGTQFLGVLTNLFNELGLTSVARMLASAVTFTGGSIDGVNIGNTTPAVGKFTTLSANSTFSATGLSSFGIGYNSNAVPAGSQGLTIGWNATQSNGEVDYIGLYSSGNAGHAFYVKTSTTTMVPVFNVGQVSATFYVPLSVTGIGNIAVSLSRFMRALSAAGQLVTVNNYVQNNYNATDDVGIEWAFGTYVPVSGLIYNMVQTATGNTAAQMTSLISTAAAYTN